MPKITYTSTCSPVSVSFYISLLISLYLFLLNNKWPQNYQQGVPLWHGSMDQLSSESGEDCFQKLKCSKVVLWTYNKWRKIYSRKPTKTKNGKSLWHLNHTYFLPFPFPDQHDTKSTPDSCSQGHRAPCPPVRGLQHPLGRGRMSVFLILTPATYEVLGKCGQELGDLSTINSYSGGRLYIGCAALKIPVLALDFKAKYLCSDWQDKMTWGYHPPSPISWSI